MPAEEAENEKEKEAQEEESLEKLSIRAELLDNQARMINEQLQRLNTMIVELNRTIETIENLKNLKKHGLLPIGSGVYITCKDVDEELFVSIGGDFIVKKTPTETKKILEQKIKELNKTVEEGQKRLVLLNSMIDEINKKAAAIGARMKNV
ncbi:MAG: prefoldin subunit alpha [Candidatus Micrarchaeota archaeon]|nr:prefoldin subunit alpha [Candidatus Micrarchaeota archaeon]